MIAESGEDYTAEAKRRKGEFRKMWWKCPKTGKRHRSRMPEKIAC
jgi:hypothetical protein